MRATYQVFHLPGFVCVVDLDVGRSVTNDAENVVADLAAELHDGVHLIYRDTDGTWDEIAFVTDEDGRPRFNGFNGLGQRSMKDAMTMIGLRRGLP